MSTFLQYLILHVLCVGWLADLGEVVHIKVIPEYLNGYQQGGNFTYCDMHCLFSENATEPDAEFYIVMNDKDVERIISKKSNAKIRILGSQEPSHYYPLLKLHFLKKHFQGTALLNRASDIPWPLIINLDKLKKVEMPKHAQPKATFIARNCFPKNNRNEIVKAIDEEIGVISPSICFNNQEWPNCGDNPCSKVEFLKKYKIYLAFENGDSPGFITDKIYHAFEAGVLPVWMGTKDIVDVVPAHSYIDVADFRTPQDVAKYLKEVLEDESLYKSYFQWKWKPFDAEFVRKNRIFWEEPMHCRMCRFVDTSQRGLRWDHQMQRGISEKLHSGRGSYSINIEYDESEEKLSFLLLVLICVTSILFYMAILLFRRHTVNPFSFFIHRRPFNS